MNETKNIYYEKNMCGSVRNRKTLKRLIVAACRF